jgi:hypothetical protein
MSTFCEQHSLIDLVAQHIPNIELLAMDIRFDHGSEPMASVREHVPPAWKDVLRASCAAISAYHSRFTRSAATNDNSAPIPPRTIALVRAAWMSAVARHPIQRLVWDRDIDVERSVYVYPRVYEPDVWFDDGFGGGHYTRPALGNSYELH